MSHHSCFEHKQSETNQHPYRDTFFSLILSAFNIKVFKKIPNGLGCIKRARAIPFMSSVGDYPVVDFGSFFLSLLLEPRVEVAMYNFAHDREQVTLALLHLQFQQDL